ncbi:DUF3108 domain-containing protein [Roseateles sp.]|uniref:DUF3108 domain-containing protein n=1 Tax=Roseateles sp. TaxID=1971397 RepID=UPI003BA7FAD1
MAERLKSGSSGPGLRIWLLLLLPVLLLHAALLQYLQHLQQDWADLESPMPPRMRVDFVRELKPIVRAPSAAQSPRALAPLKSAPSPRVQTPAEPTESAESVEPGPDTGVPASAASAAPFADAPASAPTQEAVPLPDATSEGMPALAPAQAASQGAVAVDLAHADTAFEPGPEWPPSTRLNYVLTGNYRGAIHGSAQVEWIRQGPRYQMHLDVAVGPRVAPLIWRRMSSDGQLTPAGIAPIRYDEETRVLLSERRRSTLWLGPQTLTLANGRVEDSAPGTQDAASQFVQLTWLFLTGRQSLRPGLVIELPLALPRRQYRWRYEVMGEELLQTPMGSLPTWHLKPTSLASGGDLSAEVWLAPSLQYLPVRLRIRQDDKTYVDLLLESAPLQEVERPMESRVDTSRSRQPSIVAPQVSDKEKP